jgi:cytoskeleton protein RodZ
MVSGVDKTQGNQLEMTDLKDGFKAVSVGEQLKLAREAHGWTVTQVAKRLNLSVRYISAVEENDFSVLPATIFVRGYLRNYAQCVELKSSEILSAYESHIDANKQPVKLRKREKLKAFSAAQIMRALGALSVLLFVFLSMYWWRSDDQVMTPVVDDVAVVEVETVAGETKVKAFDLGVPEVLIGDGNIDLYAGDAVLVAEFTASSWLEISDANGKVLFSGVKQAGELLQLAGQMSFDIVIGNAAAVKLSYNSAPVDLTTYVNSDNGAKLTLGR